MWRIILSLALVGGIACHAHAQSPRLAPQVRLLADDASDQDDLCFWRDATRPEQSLVITADKKAGRLFVYDLQGKVLQTLACPEPGNVDCRQGVSWGGRSRDLVVVVERAERGLRVYEVDGFARSLRRVDSGIATGDNYGGACSYNCATGQLFFFVTSKTEGVKQVELFAAGQDAVDGRIVRRWALGKCEGAVADDDAGVVYIAEERRGVWRAGAAPGDPAPGDLVIRQDSLAEAGDLEGLALARLGADQRVLIVSNQSANRFEVFRVGGAHDRLGSFALTGVEHSDGLDVLSHPLGARFPAGLFGCHADAAGKCPVWLASWAEIAAELRVSQPR